VTPGARHGNRNDADGEKEPDRRVEKLYLYQLCHGLSVVSDLDEIEAPSVKLTVW
jgi:hypothetical protein